MRKLLAISLTLFFTIGSAIAMPGYNPETDSKPLIYDTSYNDNLLKKLNDDFDKKYPAKHSVDKDGNDVYTVNYPLNAYRDEVVTPFDMQRDNTYHYINK